MPHDAAFLGAMTRYHAKNVMAFYCRVDLFNYFEGEEEIYMEDIAYAWSDLLNNEDLQQVSFSRKCVA